MTDPILQATRLCKQYQSRQGYVAAVDDISFEVGAGEFLCLVGPSGCGKSTLLRLLAGLLLPDQGQVHFQDEPLTGPRQEIGMVFQKANLMPWRTVFDNVVLPLQVKHVPVATVRDKVMEVLERVGLADFAQSYPSELSGGMAQRVAIARALIQEPKLLLLDEPFGALDALTRERLNQELVRVWQDSEETVIMVTHDVREAVFLADRVLVMTQRPGRIAEIIPVSLPRPRSSALFYEDRFNQLAYRVRQAIQ